jgi:transcriptional regulator with XRE-family HTH domain
LVYGLGEKRTDGTTADTDGIAARLQAVRAEQGYTKADLSRLAGLTAPTITKIENGGSSGVQIVEALAQALNVSPAWLAFNQGSRELPKKRRPAKSPEPSHP